MEVYYLKETWEGVHSLTLRLKQKKDEWEFLITTVYGPITELKIGFMGGN